MKKVFTIQSDKSLEDARQKFAPSLAGVSVTKKSHFDNQSLKAFISRFQTILGSSEASILKMFPKS